MHSWSDKHMYTVPYKCSSYLDQHELSSPLILGLSATRWKVYAHLTGHSGLCRFRSVYQNVDTRVTTQYRKGLLKCLGVQPAQFHVSHSPLRPFFILMDAAALKFDHWSVPMSVLCLFAWRVSENTEVQALRQALCSPTACQPVCLS